MALMEFDVLCEGIWVSRAIMILLRRYTVFSTVFTAITYVHLVGSYLEPSYMHQKDHIS